MRITRDVVSDLWPLYQSGEASPDTRALVDEFLSGEPEFARLLREDESAKLLAASTVAPAPDHETKTLNRVRRAMLKKDWPLFFAMLLSDTSFDVSPRRFIATAAVAGVFWLWFLVSLVRRLKLKA
jgi:anti-sigma factor RsiW